jgi:hypothetical protein
LKRGTDNCTTSCPIPDGYNDNESDDDIPSEIEPEFNTHEKPMLNEQSSDDDDDDDMFSDDVQNAFADYETEV